MALATRLQHPYTLAYALFHCGYLQLRLREPELVRKHALQLLQLVERYDFPVWRALGTCLLGMADAALGQAEEGLAQVDEGIALYQEMKTPPVFWPQLLAIKAGPRARREGGRGPGPGRRGRGARRQR
jgi:ATP/maltotriose-dependent transcriptional regulator MalT